MRSWRSHNLLVPRLGRGIQIAAPPRRKKALEKDNPFLDSFAAMAI